MEELVRIKEKKNLILISYFLILRLVESLKAYFPLDEKFALGEIFIPMGMRNKIIKQ